MEGSTFLLCGKSIDWINALLYENYGSLLPYKHLSDCKFRLPRNKPEAKIHYIATVHMAD